eukprot:jgi/Botrbrau1/9980/Bobra.0012s0071.2
MDETAEYEEVQNKLNSLISGRQRPTKGVWEWEHPMEAFQIYLQKLGLDQRLMDYNVVHVAGTKGKGSTCAMVERILRESGYKTGLFTSPHLIDLRERFRINGEPVDIPIFLRQFWWVYNGLEGTKTDDLRHPPYFRFLTLVGLKIFLEAAVDVTILEVGIGGVVDATNCFPMPHVCGITSLGFDHMELLGNTLPEIAWHKAGILKPQVPGFTVPQRVDAMFTLTLAATDVGAPLNLAPALDFYSNGKEAREKLGLSGEHQVVNASLAVSLAGAFEAEQLRRGNRVSEGAEQRVAQLAQGTVPDTYLRGLNLCQWPGRGQVVRDEEADSTTDIGHCKESKLEQSEQRDEGAKPGLLFFLDGAHTPESMVNCAMWFADVAEQESSPVAQSGHESVQNVLLFNCMEEREGARLLRPLTLTLRDRGIRIHHAIFTPPDSTYMSLTKGGAPDTRWQNILRQIWQKECAAGSLGQAGEDASQATASMGTDAMTAGQDSRKGMVMSSLQASLEWLRSCRRATPNTRIQVAFWCFCRVPQFP